MSNINTICSDNLSSLLSSDNYMIIKYRLGLCCEQLQTSANSSVENGDLHKATQYLAQKQGIELAVQVTENLPREITQGQFSADEALVVMGKKLEQKTEESWQNKILRTFRLRAK